MVFSSLPFLCVFLPAVFLLSLVTPGIHAKNGLLLVFSLLFYAYGEPVYVFLLIGSALLNYGFGRSLGRNRCKPVLFLAVLCNLLFLLVFKYSGFLTESVNGIFGLSLQAPQLRLPIGISFFTFQAMSYVIDVYRKDVEAQSSFWRLLLYVFLFPQLIAGPIVKYRDIVQELNERHITAKDVAEGLRRFSAGLSKKVLLANTLGAAAAAVFDSKWQEINIFGAWLGAVSYTLQIYFDFSGYSDMAIGIGRMFGFHFRENFQYPYCASGVREFWRRWHISLTAWFREYLYIPLGGNRCGRWRTAGNRLLVFLCTGIWHGANVTFLFWGAFHGFFAAAESFVHAGAFGGKKRGASLRGHLADGHVKRPVLVLMKKIAVHLYTLLVVCVGFVFFRAATLEQGFFLIKEMFTGFHFEREAVSFAVRQLHPLYLTVFAMSVISAMPVRKLFERQHWYEPVSYLAGFAGLALCMLQLAGNTYNPFIYFQF